MLRSYIFKFIFFSGIFFISLIFLPSLFLPKKIVLIGGKLMGNWASFSLKLIMSVTIEIKGKENIIKENKFFIASSHQSMFETFFLQTIFNSPIFILKKELLLIPIFGWYLKKIGSISIKRNKVTRDNLNFFDNVRNKLNTSNRPLIIFPQGTRVKYNEQPPFKKGVARIYEELKIPCQPVAINSGYVWPKDGLINADKKITISIMEPINYPSFKDDFVRNLEKKIYDELNKLN